MKTLAEICEERYKHLYSFGFTGFKPWPGMPEIEPPDPFDTYAAEIRRIAELEEQVQGS